MTSDLVYGFAFVILGAICGGSFGLPSKFVPQDTPWENLWAPFFFFATLLLPIVLGPLVVGSLFESVAAAPMAALIFPLAFGLLWGCGSMTLGMSFAFIGLSLAYAINYGAQIAFGSMAPLLLHHPDQMATRHGALILTGVVVCLAGVVVCGRAGILKSRGLATETSGQAESGSGAAQPRILIGLAVAFASGILCACYAVAFSYGGDVMKISQQQFGNAAWRSTFVVTALILWGGAVSSCLYCALQLTKNGTWSHFAKPGVGRVLLLAFLMACLHDGAILCWGVGAEHLGEKLGVSVGYAAFMSLAIMVGNVNGFFIGEWKGASRLSVTWVVAGIAVLIVGVGILGYGNALALLSEQ